MFAVNAISKEVKKVLVGLAEKVGCESNVNSDNLLWLLINLENGEDRTVEDTADDCGYETYSIEEAMEALSKPTITLHGHVVEVSGDDVVMGCTSISKEDVKSIYSRMFKNTEGNFTCKVTPQLSGIVQKAAFAAGWAWNNSSKFIMYTGYPYLTFSNGSFTAYQDKPNGKVLSVEETLKKFGVGINAQNDDGDVPLTVTTRSVKSQDYTITKAQVKAVYELIK